MVVVDPEDRAARTRWLESLFDVDAPARKAALADVDVPLEWREAGARLCALDDADGILDRDLHAIADSLFDAGLGGAAPEAGAAVGRYRLDRLIGEGGMATVWLARHQDERLPQQVAVKCLRTTLSTSEWRERFVREQRILARLTHPNITRLYDAGITDTGTPYIAMEYIAGEPITDYCDRKGLSCKERVRLFMKVCASVAHAHRSLIVHRDLKPRNVLVGEDSEPHLLDFGIAKLLDLTDADAQQTQTGLLLLTPAYAAPEQFARGAVTTATDVYGLGAVLYELLCGARARHHNDGRLQLPSSRATDAAASVRGLASSGGALRRVLRGDLDAILERALRLEPELRYASVGALEEDLERWSSGTPVAARAGSWRYRASKFMRRHWLVLGLIALAISGLSATTMVSLRESERADRSANVASREAERATVVRDFALDLMREMQVGGTRDTPQILLDRAAQQARKLFRSDAETRAALLIAVGDLNRGYGRLDVSRSVLEEAATTARSELGDASDLWLEAEAYLGHTAFREGKLFTGIPRLEQALHSYDAAGGVPGTARVRALISLGQMWQQIGENDAALELQREAFEAAGRLTDRDHPLRQSVLETYGSALAQSGRFADARRVLQENVALARTRYGDRDLVVVSALETLATCEIDAGHPEAALPLLHEAQATARAVLDRPHVMAAYVENTLGNAERRLGRSAQAQQAYEHALEIYSALYQPPHAMLVATHSNLGEAAFEQQQYDVAAVAFEEAARQRAALTDSTRFGGISLRCLAGEAHARGANLSAGIVALQACVDELRAEPDAESEYLAFALGALAHAQLRAADRAAAGRAAREALTQAPPSGAHARLLPLVALAQIGLDEGDQTMVIAQARAALDATEVGPGVRPCETARLLRELSEGVASIGEQQMVERLRQRADRFACGPTEAADGTTKS